MSTKSSSSAGYLLVLVAAGFWATLGLFYKTLMGAYGFSPLAVVFWRCGIASLALFLALARRGERTLRVSGRDWPFFLLFGLIGVAAFFYVYIYSISLAGMGVAAVLMYTAPAWVALFSAAFLGERMNRRKACALALAVAGAALVGKVYHLAGARLNLAGLATGLGAGIGYACYILFSKTAAQRGYSPWATLAYALGLGALFLLPLQDLRELQRAIANPAIVAWLLAVGLVPTLGGGLAFNAALQSIPASNASILATLEPVIATLLGSAAFGERLGAWQIAGGLLIGSAVALLRWNERAQTGEGERPGSYGVAS